MVCLSGVRAFGNIKIERTDSQCAIDPTSVYAQNLNFKIILSSLFPE